MIPGAKIIPLADDPPGFPPVGPGAQRDQNWEKYLNGFNPSGARRVPVGTMPTALPKPEAVQDKGLRAIAAAGRQQGVSYAWRANRSVDGPTRGTLAGDSSGDAAANHDDTKIGFDCGGLVRFSVFQATGNDPFAHSGPPGAGTDLLDTSKYLAPVKGGITNDGVVEKFAQPGDVLVFGNPGHQAFSGSQTHHTGIYVGNGIIIDAYESGVPVRLDELSGWAGEPTDVLRPR
jgi:cell wall-associated NlpC family hydrolase